MTNTIPASSTNLNHLLPITKSQYLLYLACAPEFWYAKHYPEDNITPDVQVLHILRQGNAIDLLARSYFQTSTDLQVDHQCNFKTDRLLARADVLLTDTRSGTKTLIEVKSATSVKPEYIDDLAFQIIAAEAVGVQVDYLGVLHVNNAYVYSGELDIQSYFAYQDVTTEVQSRLVETRSRIEAAILYLHQAEPIMHIHEYCGQKLSCPALQRQYPTLPAYTVFNISRISARKLQDLLTNGCIDIQQVPTSFQLADKQRRQVDIAQSGRCHIHHQGIQEALDGLQFPLYFLDYETSNYGIPSYVGIKPYQQMVVQWSLHVLYADDQEPLHLDFLSDGTDHPALHFAYALQAAIPNDGGSVLVWNKLFEMTRNRELGQMYPEYELFFTDINARVYDLMDVFQKQYYVHPGFQGSCSIKHLLPILAPHLSYSNLEISHGMLASIRWFEMVTGLIPETEKAQVRQHLLQYCELDTLAMVEIYRALRHTLVVVQLDEN